eukprot:Opistho-2@92555
MSDLVAVGFNSLAPETVVHHIVPYLSNADISSLSKVNSVLHSHLRGKRLYHLWPLYVRKYVEEPVFREEVKAAIPVNRIVLGGYELHPENENRESRDRPKDLSPFGGVHTANIGLCNSTDFSPLRGVHTVDFFLFMAGSFHADVLPHLVDSTVISVRGVELPEALHLSAAQSVSFKDAWGNLQCLVGVSRVDLHFSYFTDLSPLRLAKYVSLNDMDVDDISALANAREIRLMNCPKVMDVSMLKNVRVFVMDDCDFTTIPPELGSIHRLELTSPVLRDVSAVRSIHTLILVNCHRIENISALRNVQHTLDLSVGRNTYVGMPTFDVSCLSRLHTLRLDFRPITGISQLGGVHTLSIARAKFNDDDLSSLRSVHTLSLEDTRVADVSSLGHVHTLNLSFCKHLGDLSALSRCYSLNFTAARICDVSLLGEVHTLVLQDTTVSEVSSLGGVHTLDLCNTKCLDVSMLGSVWSLDLSCTKVTNVSALGSVWSLDLAKTPVSDVSMLGGVHFLNLRDCKNVTDVSALGNVHTLYLGGTHVIDVSSLSRVCVLAVDDSLKSELLKGSVRKLL